MDKRKFIPLLFVGALALVLVFGVITYSSVSAQDETPTPAFPNQTIPGKPMRGLDKGGANVEDVAAALGIEVEELQAAREAAAVRALEQAVSQGLITQEQADQFPARGGSRFGLPGRWLNDSGIDLEAILADELGISVEQLQAAYEQAFTASLDRAVENGRLTEEQGDLIKSQRALVNDSNFQSSMQSAFRAAVNQAVTDGVISQSQADQILENSAGAFSGRGGFGGRGGRGGKMHPGLEAPAAPSSDGA